MRIMRFAVCLVALAAMLFATDVHAKKLKKDIYLFGCSASFTDSIVYITDVQVIEGVKITSKSLVLPDRESYSAQLKDFLAEKMNLPHRTCFVIFSDKAKKITKKLTKLKNLYTVKSPGKYDVRYLRLDDFRFTVVSGDEEPVVSE